MSIDKTNSDWIRVLTAEGYEHHCASGEDLAKIKRLGFSWRKILKLTKVAPPARIFEVGCGGGRYLGTLAVNGFKVNGLDVSDHVLNRARNYLEEIKKFQNIEASVELGDIFRYPVTQQYDLVFHYGVVEHFLELDERIALWRKMKELIKPNGWVVSLVPNGQHFMRRLIREKRLGGYDIPEIDYSPRSHRGEFEAIGLQNITVYPFNYFFYLTYHPAPFVLGSFSLSSTFPVTLC